MWLKGGQILLLLRFVLSLVQKHVRQTSLTISSGIGPEDFASMLIRESDSELKMIETFQGRNAVTDAWRKFTEYWLAMKSPQTYLVCDECPTVSGFEKRQQINARPIPLMMEKIQ